MAARSDNNTRTLDNLYALGPKAVEILERAIAGGGETPSAQQVSAAQDVLDRMNIRRTNT